MNQIATLMLEPLPETTKLSCKPDWVVGGCQIESLKPSVRNPGQVFRTAIVFATSNAVINVRQGLRDAFDYDRHTAASPKGVIHHANAH